jgi:hypothetical protein
MERISTVVSMLKHQERQTRAPLPGAPIVEVVNDTFTGTATRATHCCSLIRWAKASSCLAQACKVGTRIFTWFGPSECNTLRPRWLLYYDVCSTS